MGYQASKRHNQMICVRLCPIANPTPTPSSSSSSSSSSFVVGTYHMPCMFYKPAAMNIHSMLSVNYIHSFSRGVPYIYCGDFNIKPKSSMYDLITKGKYDVDTISEDEVV